MSNLAQVDLKANPAGVKSGTDDARKYVEKYVADAKKYFEELGISGTELAERLDAIKESLKGVTEENLEAAKSSSIFNAEMAETAIVLAASFGLLGPYAKAVAEVKVAHDVLGFALNQTTEKMQVFDDRLGVAKKLVDESGGNVEKLKAKLEELGVTAEDAGIKIQNSWEKVHESEKKLFDQLFGGTKIVEEVQSSFSKFFSSIYDGYDRATSKVGDYYNAVIKKTTEGAKAAKDFTARAINAVWEPLGMGADSQQQTDEEGGQKEREKAERAEKLQQIYNETHKESLARMQQLADAEAGADRAKIENYEIVQVKSKEEIETKLKGLEETRRWLIDNNKYQTKAGDENIASTEKWKNRLVEIREEQNAANELFGKQIATFRSIQEGYDKQEESQQRKLYSEEMLIGLLKAAEEAVDEYNKKGLEGAKDAEEALLHYKTINDLLHNKRKADIAEEKADRNDEVEEILEKQVRAFKTKQDLEEYTLSLSHEKQLKSLQEQGANYQELHRTKIGFMEQEIALALEGATSQQEVDAINAQAAKRRLKEEFDFEADQANKLKKIDEINRSVAETQSDANFKKKLAGMELADKKEKDIHAERMKHIDEEEARELSKTKDAIEQAAIRAQAQKARIQEVTDFELQEMKRIKDLENKVKRGELSFEDGMKQAGFKPPTRKEINENLKKQAVARKEAVANNKKNVGEKKRAAMEKANWGKFARQQGAKQANDDVAERAARNKAGKAVGGFGDTAESLLKDIAEAAKTTNVNEKELIKAVESAGGLA